MIGRHSLGLSCIAYEPKEHLHSCTVHVGGYTNALIYVQFRGFDFDLIDGCEKFVHYYKFV